MKYIKKYEVVKFPEKNPSIYTLEKPKVGDYVLIKLPAPDKYVRYLPEYIDYIENNVCKLIYINNSTTGCIIQYKSSYYDMTGFSTSRSIWAKKIIFNDFKLENIYAYSDNEDDLQTLLISKKYNLL